ncbi:hypothetical protein N665_0113s0011 [Sinapis alba]|nr:hypothetical protein N665_0113s0011 [Sinapis alba]
MSSSSSSSSRHGPRRYVIGVPTRCWCGQNITPLRFYRCEITLQRKTESHLFKWEDKAFFNEIMMVDAKCTKIVHDLSAQSKTLMDELDTQKYLLTKGTEDMMEILKANSLKMVQEIDINSNPATHTTSPPSHNSGCMKNIVVAVVVIGSMAYST